MVIDKQHDEQLVNDKEYDERLVTDKEHDNGWLLTKNTITVRYRGYQQSRQRTTINYRQRTR